MNFTKPRDPFKLSYVFVDTFTEAEGHENKRCVIERGNKILQRAKARELSVRACFNSKRKRIFRRNEEQREILFKRMQSCEKNLRDNTVVTVTFGQK